MFPSCFSGPMDVNWKKYLIIIGVDLFDKVSNIGES
jgi:hypothetical protein